MAGRPAEHRQPLSPPLRLPLLSSPRRLTGNLYRAPAAAAGFQPAELAVTLTSAQWGAVRVGLSGEVRTQGGDREKRSKLGAEDVTRRGGPYQMERIMP